MANALVPGWEPGSQTNYKYRPNQQQQQHLGVSSHLLLERFASFSVFSKKKTDSKVVVVVVVVTAGFLKLL